MPCQATPALFTRIVTGPSSVSVRPTIASTAATSATSAATAIAPRPQSQRSAPLGFRSRTARLRWRVQHWALASLDAQYDAAEAYIRSQAHAGWTLNRARYDDGGYSGGSTDRPALQRLLADVKARKVDVIVVSRARWPTSPSSSLASVAAHS
jgi:hypothetical protein